MPTLYSCPSCGMFLQAGEVHECRSGGNSILVQPDNTSLPKLPKLEYYAPSVQERLEALEARLDVLKDMEALVEEIAVLLNLR